MQIGPVETTPAGPAGDVPGLAYMQRAGYDPRGMVTLFEELLSRRRRNPGAVERFFASHPVTEDRIHRMPRRILE